MNSYQLAGPYILNQDTIEKNMWNVALALLPAVIAASYFFGLYALYLIFAPAIFAVLLEKPITEHTFPGDGSAFVTGMLLGFSLPPDVPWWMPLLGVLLAIIIGKQLFGGLGNNVFNPALVGRGILRLSFASYFTNWPAPLTGVTTATPLEIIESDTVISYFSGEGQINLWDMFIGNIPGTVGETSALALLLGASYLFYKGYIGWRISGGYIISAAIMSVFLGINPLFTILSGALFLGAFYMATDMVTSPSSKDGRLIFGIGCGVLTVLLRAYSSFSGGVTFAILAMNGVSYLFDTIFEGPREGQIKERKKFYQQVAVVLILSIILFFVLGWSGFKISQMI